MTKQNVNIINLNSLYEILDEIKENLTFNISKYENEKEFPDENKDSLNHSLFIVNSKNKILNDKNFLVLDKHPISLIKLIELINIKLLKIKFKYQSKINIKDYQLNLNSKFFSKNDINLKLTEKEIKIILYLDEKKTKHKVLDLQKNIWGYSSDLETHTVETHIYRLRKKIKEKFKDNDFILSHDDGYFIE
tara:strand:- start:1064 stop:1636 length:573 start_codon:yes stop_codon:yes gene_type:complete